MPCNCNRLILSLIDAISGCGQPEQGLCADASWTSGFNNNVMIFEE